MDKQEGIKKLDRLFRAFKKAGWEFAEDQLPVNKRYDKSSAEKFIEEFQKLLEKEEYIEAKGRPRGRTIGLHNDFSVTGATAPIVFTKDYAGLQARIYIDVSTSLEGALGIIFRTARIEGKHWGPVKDIKLEFNVDGLRLIGGNSFYGYDDTETILKIKDMSEGLLRKLSRKGMFEKVHPKPEMK